MRSRVGVVFGKEIGHGAAEFSEVEESGLFRMG
jgi:hypothetical protein